jgi:putative membrane protein
MPETPNEPDFDATKITRPAPVLLTYYILVSVPTFFFALPVLWFRYLTLQYKFDSEGVSMQWGLLFRKEILLTYRRIQDIHLTRNIVQRWFGLATVGIQTASASSGPEMSIEGILEAEPLRDFLYQQMRGARGETEPSKAASNNDVTVENRSNATELLREIRDNLVLLNQRSEE